jgi:hypothetical protein
MKRRYGLLEKLAKRWRSRFQIKEVQQLIAGKL